MGNETFYWDGLIVNVYVPTFLRPTCCAGKQQADVREDNVHGGIGFSKEEAKTFGQLLLH